jgi:hypothetical protein
MDLTHFREALFTTPGCKEALLKLVDMLSVDRRLAVLQKLSVYMKALVAGLEVEIPRECAPIIVLSLLHVSMGCPLVISDALFDAWMADTSSDDVDECPVDGYRQPPRFSRSCVVCGAVVGRPGEFLRRRSGETVLHCQAVATLAEQLSSGKRSRLLQELDLHSRRRLAGLPSSPSIVLQAALVISHQYLAVRTPLILNDALFDRWAAAEHDGCAECVQCGYRMPEGEVACVLCGAQTGPPGVFKANRERKARAAGSN